MNLNKNIIKALVVDDDPVDRKILLKALEESKANLEIIGTASNGEECIEFFDSEMPDVVFMDIDMPGMSGYEIAETILSYENPPIVVFVTGRQDYAIKAFEIDAIDYVTKPFDVNRITKTIERISKIIESKKTDFEKLHEVINKLNTQETCKVNKLAVKDYEERTIRFIDPGSIIFIERVERRVVIYTKEKSFPTYFSIDSLEKKLSPDGFIRVNPKSIINMNFIDHLIPNGDGTYDVLLKDEKKTKFTVSRSRVKSLLGLASSDKK